MEVGEVRDPQPVELQRKSPNPNRLDFEPNPAGLEPPPRRGRGSGADQAEQRRWYQEGSVKRCSSSERDARSEARTQGACVSVRYAGD
jgi:hypothetical protein